MADKSLEERVNDVVVSYNALPWWVYPVNWAANFPLRRLRGYEKLEVPHRFKAIAKYNGKRVGRLARIKDPNPDHKGIYYGVAYDTSGDTIDPIVEWAEDPSRTVSLNDGEYSLDRKVAMGIAAINGNRNISMFQHKKSFFDSWYGLPFKLPFYLATLPFNLIFNFKRLFGGRDLVELGKLYQVENLDLPGDITLDQNVIRQYLTLGLGKYYDLRDQDNHKIAKISRSWLVKLLTFGLKNRYKIRLYSSDNNVLKATYGLVDYLQNEFKFRARKPIKKDVSVENVYRFGP